MRICDLGQGFNLVPLKETDVPNVMHPRRQLSRAFRGECLPMRLPMRQRAYLTRNCDVMALQMSAMVKAMLREGDFEKETTND